MREGSEGSEEVEGSDEKIEDIRKRLLEEHELDGVDEELLEVVRERLADKQEVQDAGAKGAWDEEGKDIEAKGEPQETVENPGMDGITAEATAGYVKGTEVASTEVGTGSETTTDSMNEDPLGIKNEEASAATEGEKAAEPEQEAKTVQVETEGHNQNDDQLLVTEHVRPGQGRDEPAETAGLQRLQEVKYEQEELRILETVDYGKGANVRAPMGDLERAGYDPPDHNAIVQLGLRAVDGEDVETVFARYIATDRRAEAYVGDVGGVKGSEYELVEARGVDEDRMAREFERGRCEHMQNVRLEHEEGKMLLDVDGRQMEFEGYKMSTSGSHLVLRGKLDGEDDCKIEFDGRRAAVKFGRDYPVEGMRMEKDELVVRYEQSRNEAHEHRQSLDHSDIGDGKLSLGELQKPDALRLARLLDAPEGTDGVYTFAVDKRLQESVRSVLEEAMKEGTRRYGVVKGEVGESLISNLMSLAGWDRIERHPFNETRKEGVTGNGTDHVFRDPDHKLSISESKYWGQIENALKRGEIQVGAYYDRRRKYHGEEIERGYVMAMDWNLSDDPIRIHVRRVRRVRRVRPVVNSNV